MYLTPIIRSHLHEIRIRTYLFMRQASMIAFNQYFSWSTASATSSSLQTFTEHKILSRVVSPREGTARGESTVCWRGAPELMICQRFRLQKISGEQVQTELNLRTFSHWGAYFPSILDIFLV